MTSTSLRGPSAGAGPDRSRRGSVRCHFELSPPRHFVYPAILVLLSEKPRNGYRLLDPLLSLGFGPFDRPAVYRALAELERDGLLSSWSAEAKAGATRQVYAVTAAGREALDEWMMVLAEERGRIDHVLERHAALGGPRILCLPELCLPELCLPGPVAPATTAHGALSYPGGQRHGGISRLPETAETPVCFEVVPERSAVLIRARSTVGPIEFGTTGVSGTVRVSLQQSRIVATDAITARLEVQVGTLTSGNKLYDAELLRRVDARMYPIAVVDLDGASPLGSDDRFEVQGRLTFHGVTRELTGVVSVSTPSPNKLTVSGDDVIDIRDFEITSPTVLMLKIYPDVRVYLQLEAESKAPPVQLSI